MNIKNFDEYEILMHLPKAFQHLPLLSEFRTQNLFGTVKLFVLLFDL